MSSRKIFLYKKQLITSLIILLLLKITIALPLLYPPNLRSLASFVLKHSIRSTCKNCTVEISNLNITSHSVKHFTITSALSIIDKQQNTPVLNIKDLKLEINLLKIFSHLTLPVKIYIDGLNVDLNTLLQKIKKNHSHNISHHHILDLLNNNKKFISKEIVEIKNAYIKEKRTTYKLTLSEHIKQGVTHHILSLSNGNLLSEIDAHTLKHHKTITTHYNITRLPALLIKHFIPPEYRNNIIESIDKDLLIIGNASISHDTSNGIKSLNAKFNTQDATQINPNFTISLTSNNLSKQLNIDNFTLSLPTSQGTISAKGSIKYPSSILYRNVSLNLLLNTDKININAISLLWPNTPQNPSKEWFAQSIKDGQFLNLTGELYIKDLLSKPENIEFNANARFQNFDLKYTPQFPKIDSLQGDVVFTPKLITFNIQNGKMIDSTINNSSIATIDLKDKDVPLTIKTTCNGPSRDFINFIPQKNLSQLQTKKINLPSIEGNTTAQINITIPLAKDITLENTDLNIKADLDATRLTIFDTITLQGKLKLNIHNHLLSVTGTPLVNDQKTKFSWHTYLKDDMEFDNKLTLDASIDTSKEKLSVLNDRVYIDKGILSTNIEYINKHEKEHIYVNAHLDDVQVNIPDVDIIKKQNKPSSFKLVLNNHNKQLWKTETCHFTAPGEDINISSYAEINNTLDAITRLDSDIKCRNNNMKINLSLNHKEDNIKINGSYVVPNKARMFQFLSSTNFSSNKNQSISINVDKAVMHNDITFNEISGNLECNKNRCKNSILSMKMRDKNDQESLLKIYNKKHSITLQTNNAASLLKGLDAYTDIEGGKATLKLFLPKKQSSKNASLPINGEIVLENFEAIQTPIITKMILMTPFTQIVEQLKGESLIKFRTFKGTFSIQNNKIIIAKSIATGDLITATIRGSIDLEKKQISLKGRLIPNCLVNKFISNMQNKNEVDPERYQIATDYKISGSLESPTVSVNPITLLVSLLTKPLAMF